MAIQIAPPIVQVVRLALGRPEASGQLTLLWLLATACEKNLPLDAAVDSLAADARGQWQYRLTDFAALLRRGKTVDEAIQCVPGVLSAEAVLAAKVGAANGALGKSLRIEAERQSAMQSDEQGTSIMGSVIYVCGMLAILSSVVGFMMIWIIPKFKKIFDDFGTELPSVTRGLINSADLNNNFGIFILSPLVLFAVTLPALWLLSLFGIGVRMPAFLNLKRLFPRLDVGPMLRQLGVVVAEGKPLVDGLEVVSTQHPNTPTWRKMSQVYEDVKSGESPWATMQHHKLLRSRERHLLESAERVGNLGWALQLLGRQIEDRQDHTIKSALQLIRPFCIAITGLFVGWVAIAMFAPLIKLLNDLA
jgi:type IV pilus assembly protein PilC